MKQTLIRSIRTAVLSLGLVLASAAPAHAQPKIVYDQLTPENSTLLLIDYQPQFAFSTKSIDIETLMNNASGLAKAAQAFNVPTVLTTITADAFGGPTFPKVQAAAGSAKAIDRTVINAWDDPRVANAVRSAGRRKIVMAGLWTDNCVMLPALSALKEGYEVYVVTDASGDSDAASHERAIQRLVQAGAVPITWLPVMLEWQADWSRSATAGKVAQIAQDHAGAVGLGLYYRGLLDKARKP